MSNLKGVSKESFAKKSAELLAHGYKDAASTLLQLLVDDGISSRGNRKALFDSKYKHVGICTSGNDNSLVFASEV
jgi:uncharacterized protein YkwD